MHRGDESSGEWRYLHKDQWVRWKDPLWSFDGGSVGASTGAFVRYFVGVLVPLPHGKKHAICVLPSQCYAFLGNFFVNQLQPITV